MTEDKIKQLKQKLKSCESDKRQHLEDLQRAKADFLNSRKRLEISQKENAERLENDFVLSLLPLCDSFDMAMSDKDAWNAVDSTWRQGVEGIYNQLQSVLQQYQVSASLPLGEVFDPNKHDAVGNHPSDDKHLSGSIFKVVQPGYERQINDKTIILRPARVIVVE